MEEPSGNLRKREFRFLIHILLGLNDTWRTCRDRLLDNKQKRTSKPRRALQSCMLVLN